MGNDRDLIVRPPSELGIVLGTPSVDESFAAISRFAQEEGGEGWTIDTRRRKLLILRFRDGVAYTHKAFDIETLQVPA